MSEPSSILVFLGRFHPLLVHLPIGILVALGLLELLARRPGHQKARAAAGYLLALAVPASVLTAILGWMLSKSGGYEEGLLNWHLWTGIGTAALCIVAAILYRLRLLKAYRGCLVLTLAALVVASHFGGSLTHGSDYLVRHAPGPLRAFLRGAETVPAKPAAPSAFASVIHPILEKNCIACHGPEKAKGGLRFDSVALMLQKGEHGPSVVPGNAAKSEMIKHMRLPLDHEEHMPPKGKPQPSAEDLALMEWWIDAGAFPDASLTELKQPPEIARILSSRVTPAPQVPEQFSREQVLTLAGDLGASTRATLSPLGQDSPALLCNARLAGTNFGDAQLRQIAESPVAPVVQILDLGGTGITAEGLRALGRFTSLKRLHLERTGVNDTAMPSIARLGSLEYLNLYGTSVTDAGLAALGTLPKLDRVYLWGTQVTEEGAKSLASARLSPEEKSRLEQEIEAIKARIKEEEILVYLGAPAQPVLTNAPSTNAVATVAVNTTCPISGKPADPSKTLTHEGRIYAFCCDDCLKKAKEDPGAVLAKQVGS